MPVIRRGEVWLADLGLAAKVRPCLVVSVQPQTPDRMLVTLVPHTTSIRGSHFEVSAPMPFLKAGAFDAQGLVTVAPPRLIRKLGELSPAEIKLVESAVAQWLGMDLA